VYPEGSEDPDAPTAGYTRMSAHQNQNLELGSRTHATIISSRWRPVGIGLLNKWANCWFNRKNRVELTGEKVDKWQSEYALRSRKGPVSGTSILVYRSIEKLLREACGQLGKSYDDDVYNKVTLALMALVNTNEPGAEIRRILRSELGIPLYYIRTDTNTRLDWDINDYLNEIKWSNTMTYVAGIGQSVTLLSPIGVARYISALVNGGHVYEATLIKDIQTPEGESIMSKESNLVRDLGAPDEYLEAIKEGMKQVISGEDGTASDEFENYKYKDDIGGKTGTAQVSTIDLENNSWFVAFAPFDSPEIAVVVYIPHGYKGIYSAYTAQTIIEYYLDKKNQEEEASVIPYPNTIIP
jgi:penicillin-binding protein 2